MAKCDLEIGDVVKDWKIVDIFYKYNGQQNVSYAKLQSIIDDRTREAQLSRVKNGQIGYPDRRRPDNTKRNKTHGLSKTRLYSIWVGMKNRCLNPKQGAYKHYGGRGITICDGWMEFEKFAEWANQNGYQEDLTLDRVDNNGNYCPENCKWASKLEQTINKRCVPDETITAFGETKHLVEWAHDPRCGSTVAGLRYRIGAGWKPEDAILKPPERKHKASLKNWLQENYPDIYDEYLNI